ncbi:MAG: peptide chain release factor N(5)-glutamine methyltransferase [Clostridiaceae bacterium]|nr:peptide chain release factor N(5)-glutamine methyltransferase [Eubacteriales bacterium]
MSAGRMGAATVRESLFAAREALFPIANEEAAFSARLLLCHALGVSDLLPLYASPMPEAAQTVLSAYVARRLSGEPLQYILGEWEFMGLPFYVERGVLIPRQDTETLAEHAVSLIAAHGYKTALDLCCGTGCIGISLHKLAGIAVTLADIDDTCLALARKNAARNAVSAQVLQSDLFGAISERFDLIACNPPYIPTGELSSLQKEVQAEPQIALDGGADGLKFYRRIAAAYKSRLNAGGALLLEVGISQADDVKKLFENAYTVKDLNGVERVVAVTG